MAVDDGLDLVAGDVLAAAADAIVQPVHEVQPARIVNLARIARVEPEIPPRLHGLVGHLVVAHVEAERHLGTHQDLADLVGRQRQVGRWIGDDDIEVVIQRRSGTARHHRVGGVGVSHHVDLGHAVALHDLHAEAFLELGSPLRGYRQSDDRPQLVAPVTVGAGAPPDELRHDPERIRERDGLVDDGVEPLAHAESLGHVHRRATVQRGVHLHEQAVRVEQRHAAEEPVIRADVEPLCGGKAEQVAVRLGHQHALGGAGGARGVHDRADIAGLGLELRVGSWFGAQQFADAEHGGAGERTGGGICTVAVVHQQGGLDLLSRRGVGTGIDVVEAVEQAPVHGHDAWLRIADLVFQEGAAQVGVDRHEDGPPLVCRDHQQHEFGAVGEQAEQAIPGLQADVSERGGEPVGQLVERGIADRAAVFE